MFSNLNVLMGSVWMIGDGNAFQTHDIPLKITRAYKVTSPWSDVNARFVGPNKWKPLVHELFTDPGFMGLFTKDHLRDVADNVMRDNQAALSPGGKHVVLVAKAKAKAEKLKTAAKARTPLSKLACPFKG